MPCDNYRHWLIDDAFPNAMGYVRLMGNLRHTACLAGIARPRDFGSKWRQSLYCLRRVGVAGGSYREVSGPFFCSFLGQ